MSNLELGRLTAYLQQKMPHARNLQLANLFRIPGGASKETWSVDALWEEETGQARQGLVVRRDLSTSLLDTELEREFRLYQKLWGTPVPVPKVLWLEKEPGWLGGTFYIMERIDGAQTNPQALLSPEKAYLHQKIAREMARILAHIHALDWQGLGLDFLGPAPEPAQCAQREIAYWEQVMRQEALEPQPELEAAFRWMKRHPPPPAQRITVVHGDYRTGNYLYNDSGILAFLDWELAHLGDPIEDLAWVRLFRFGRDDRPAGGLVPWEDFQGWYEEYSGLRVDPQSLRFWGVFDATKAAIILMTGGWRFSLGRTDTAFLALYARAGLNFIVQALDLMGVKD